MKKNPKTFFDIWNWTRDYLVSAPKVGMLTATVKYVVKKKTKTIL